MLGARCSFEAVAGAQHLTWSLFWDISVVTKRTFYFCVFSAGVQTAKSSSTIEARRLIDVVAKRPTRAAGSVAACLHTPLSVMNDAARRLIAAIDKRRRRRWSPSSASSSASSRRGAAADGNAIRRRAAAALKRERAAVQRHKALQHARAL